MEEKSQEPPKGLVDLASVVIPNRCIYCQSENIVKRGKRKKKLEEVQLYLCNDCAKTFTGQIIIKASEILKREPTNLVSG